jgi:hypothetical protein
VDFVNHPRHIRRDNGASRQGHRQRVSLASIVLAASLLISYCEIVFAQARKPTEYEVKAAYLYNFGKFVRWPAPVTSAGGGSFLICVLGQNPFGSTLDSTVSGESIEGKHLSIRFIASAADASKCRILFISDSEDHHLAEILAELSQRPVLTVSDISEFVDRGGDIGFVQQGDRIRFSVNLAAAEKAGLAMSSDLLKVAISVKRDGQSGE